MILAPVISIDKVGPSCNTSHALSSERNLHLHSDSLLQPSISGKTPHLCPIKRTTKKANNEDAWYRHVPTHWSQWLQESFYAYGNWSMEGLGHQPKLPLPCQASYSVRFSSSKRKESRVSRANAMWVQSDTHPSEWTLGNLSVSPSTTGGGNSLGWLQRGLTRIRKPEGGGGQHPDR